MNAKYLLLDGANMDIDLTTKLDKISWKQDRCPWNIKEKTNCYKCAVKNTSICDYFRGITNDDEVMCSYPDIKLKKDK
jgi:hypothetical protein